MGTGASITGWADGLPPAQTVCLAIRVGRRCKAEDEVAVLEDLTSLYPAPAFIRSDNGPAFNGCAEAQELRPGRRCP